MKQILLLLFLLSLFLVAFTQNDQWAWMQGDILPQIPVYGMKGISTPANKPGARHNATFWQDTSGNFWVFGGTIANTSSIESIGERPKLNDLWRYMPSTGQWTWMGGDSTANRPGVYGIKGLAAAANNPGARMSLVSWADASGNLWLFGGRGYSATGLIDFNDLWKYTPATGQWTWINGDSTTNRTGVYGTKGLAAPSNKPGAREYATGSADASGNLWLFGGRGYSNSTSGGLEDLWKYTTSTGLWTWMSGDSSTGQRGVYGTKGIAAPGNKPGGRQNVASCTDAYGNLWLFSGNSSTTPNDLWKYTPSTGLWTWMSGDSVGHRDLVSVYGTKGVAAAANTPGPRIGSVSWGDTSGNIWVFGGYGNDVPGFRGRWGYFNDLWKYNPSTGWWTWMSGDNFGGGAGVYGTKGQAALNNKPVFRQDASGYTDASGNLWLFGGESLNGYDGSYENLNDLWKYTLSTGEWTWISGDNNKQFNGGIYGTKGTASVANKPGGRESAVRWTDTSGNLWLFGGSGNSSVNKGVLNDLWRYTPSTSEWTWMSGDSTVNARSVYGTKGTAASANNPGSRSGAVSWTDSSGNLWLFGGSGYNDLWKYAISTGQWTWMSGDSTTRQPDVYGAKGVTAPTNKPGGRYNAISWADTYGNLWLFGGLRFISGEYLKLNDLWKYTPSTGWWTWMSGDSTGNEHGVYGTKGTAAYTNKPGGREYAVSWTDTSGDLWLFGGLGEVVTVAELFNDLWKYSVSTSQWTWVSGDSAINQTAVYGTKGVAASTNKPGARFSAVSWTDASGALWLLGGNSMDVYGNLNDFWKFTPATSQWTWMGGDSTINALGNYGIQGVFAATNKPAARNSAVSWIDKSGTLWLFGGNSYISSYKRDVMNDLWKYSIAAATSLPVRFSSFTAHKQMHTVLVTWTTAQEQNSRYYIIERSSTGVVYDSIGTVAARNITSSATNYAFIDLTPLSGANFYRLKQEDKDGRFMYSGVAKVVMREDAARFTVIQNPVQGALELNVQLPVAQKLTLHVRNMNGQLLLSEERMGNKGSSLLSVPVGHLSRGVYLIHVQSKNINSIKTFVR